MPHARTKVVVAMSGGVDSSVAACLLAEQGYDVIGLFMRIGNPEREAGDASEEANGKRSHQGCCSAADAADARHVAGMLGIPFYALNFQEAFEGIIQYFADEYATGRTPNPCVVCNDRLKFGRLLDYADAVGADHIATGHYARVEGPAGARTLCRGTDVRKDQSYVLFGLAQSTLERTLFPIGHLTKDEVRQIAARLNLPNQDKPDSVEICFVPDRNYAEVVREKRPDAFEPGEVTDSDGRVLGQHPGLGHYTVGQRRGLGIALGEPAYVTQLNTKRNTVVLGKSDDLLKPGLIAAKAHFIVDTPDRFRAMTKIRYLHRAQPAEVHRLSGGRVKAIFDQPQRAITPGQAVVFYDSDRVLGGAWIDGPLDADAPEDDTRSAT